MGSCAPSVGIHPPVQNETITRSAKADENEEKKLCSQTCSSCISLHEQTVCTARLKLQF